MTKRKILGIGGLLLVLSVAGGLLNFRGQGPSGDKGMTTITVCIDGPSCCSYCPASLDVALAKLNGILQTRTDYELGMTQIRYDREKIDVQTIFEAIKERGYKVISVVGG